MSYRRRKTAANASTVSDLRKHVNSELSDIEVAFADLERRLAAALARIAALEPSP